MSEALISEFEDVIIEDILQKLNVAIIDHDAIDLCKNNFQS
jgi:hypothetical protein